LVVDNLEGDAAAAAAAGGGSSGNSHKGHRRSSYSISLPFTVESKLTHLIK